MDRFGNRPTMRIGHNPNTKAKVADHLHLLLLVFVIRHAPRVHAPSQSIVVALEIDIIVLFIHTQGGSGKALIHPQ